MTFSELLRLDQQIPAIPQGLPTGKPSQVSPPKRETNHEPTIDTTTPCDHDTTAPSDPHPKTSTDHATTKPLNPSANTSGHHAATTRELVRQLRRAVHRIGKEAATYRFTAEEKVALMEVVYQQGKVGLRTSENEIVRVAVNWLLQNHRAQGEGSVLSLVLEALRA